MASAPSQADAGDIYSAFAGTVSSGRAQGAVAQDLREKRYHAFDDLVGQADDTETQEAHERFAEREHTTLRLQRKKRSVADFDIICELGSGAFGIVHLVKSKACNSVFALKQMDKDRYQKKNWSDLVFAERDLLGQVDSRWFASLIATFQDSGHVYMVMEFIQGGELLLHLEMKGCFTPAETQFYMAELLLALEVVHKHGFVHRDVKPDNIMLTSSGHLKLLDFGLCKNECSITPEVRAQIGTPPYMAPEAFDGMATAASDIWALGVITFECLYGGIPFHGGEKTGREATAAIRVAVMNFATVFPDRLEKARNLGFIPPDAEHLLRGIISPEEERLSAAVIRKEPFFRGVDFEHVHEIEPAIKPKVSGELDVSNFLDAQRRSALPGNNRSHLVGESSMQWAHYEFDREAHNLQRPDGVLDCFHAASTSFSTSENQLRS